VNAADNDLYCSVRGVAVGDALYRRRPRSLEAFMTTDKLPTEAMIEAGCEAMAKVHSAMRDRNLSDEPECMDDFDEGDVCREIYLAMEAVRPPVGEGWQPIETAPKDERYILVCGPEGVDVACWDSHWGDGAWLRYQTAEYDNNDANVASPTHWMPLPEPPAMQSRV
jgi:hypothetical protein